MLPLCYLRARPVQFGSRHAPRTPYILHTFRRLAGSYLDPAKIVAVLVADVLLSLERLVYLFGFLQLSLPRERLRERTAGRNSVRIELEHITVALDRSVQISHTEPEIGQRQVRQVVDGVPLYGLLESQNRPISPFLLPP